MNIDQQIYYSLIIYHEYHVKTKVNENIIKEFIDYHVYEQI